MIKTVHHLLCGLNFLTAGVASIDGAPLAVLVLSLLSVFHLWMARRRCG